MPPGAPAWRELRRLCCLGQSPVGALISVDWRGMFASSLLHLPRPNPSRSVSCTNPCTNLVTGLRVSAVRRARPRTPRLSLTSAG